MRDCADKIIGSQLPSEPFPRMNLVVFIVTYSVNLDKVLVVDGVYRRSVKEMMRKKICLYVV